MCTHLSSDISIYSSITVLCCTRIRIIDSYYRLLIHLKINLMEHYLKTCSNHEPFQASCGLSRIYSTDSSLRLRLADSALGVIRCLQKPYDCKIRSRNIFSVTCKIWMSVLGIIHNESR